jgi:integrase
MSIYPHKDKHGTLTGKFCVELTYKGQRRRGRFDTIEDARAAQLSWGHEFLNATAATPVIIVPPAPPKTLGYLFDMAKDQMWRGRATEVQSLQRLEAVVSFFGRTKPLASLTTLDIDNLIGELLADREGSTVNRYLSTLHKLLDWGRERGVLKAVPTFSWQTEAEGRIRWITEEEEAALYKALGASPVAKVVKIAIATGMRRNELLGLTETTVEPEWVRLWKTKTNAPRSVPITKETYDALKDLILSGMPTLHQLRYAWDSAKQDIGLRDDPLFVFHATRHTCATRLVRANVNIRVIQQWLGHKRIETTLRYAHVNDTMLTGALTSLQGYTTDRAGVGRLLPEYTT